MSAQRRKLREEEWYAIFVVLFGIIAASCALGVLVTMALLFFFRDPQTQDKIDSAFNLFFVGLVIAGFASGIVACLMKLTRIEKKLDERRGGSSET